VLLPDSDRGKTFSSPPPMYIPLAPSRRCYKSVRLLTFHWLLSADQSAGGGLGFLRGGVSSAMARQCIDTEDSQSPPPTASSLLCSPSFLLDRNLGYIRACWPLELNILSATVLQAQRLVKKSCPFLHISFDFGSPN
jgi:hypothetical protein